MPSKPSFKCALITGATSGVGEALAHLLAPKVPQLILTGRDPSKLKEKLPSAICLALDLSSDRKKLIDEIHQRTPDLVINNAGFGLYGPATTLSTEEQLQMIEVNIAALTEITLEAAKALLNQNAAGTILNLSSATAFYVYPTFATYAASKAYVTSFSQALHAELKNHKIAVLTACPGQIATDFRRRAAKGKPQESDSLAMTPDQAALHLWEQIENGKPLSIFDGRYRLLVGLSRLIPKRLLQLILMRGIENRY